MKLVFFYWVSEDSGADKRRGGKVFFSLGMNREKERGTFWLTGLSFAQPHSTLRDPLSAHLALGKTNKMALFTSTAKALPPLAHQNPENFQVYTSKISKLSTSLTRLPSRKSRKLHKAYL